MLEHRQLQNVCTLLTAGSKNKWNALTYQVRWLIEIFEGLKSQKSLLEKFSLLTVWKAVINDMCRALQCLISPEHFYQQIRQLETRYKVELGDEPTPYIRVNFGTVHLRHCNMGEFAVDFTVGESGRLIRRIVHTGQLGPGMNSQIPHPHVAGHAFCAGADRHTFSILLEMGELVEYVSLLEQLLHTYNPRNAYIQLSKVACTNCGRHCNPSRMLCCQHCNGYVCHYCGLSACISCQREICSDCGTPCCLCGKAICANCLASQHTAHHNDLSDKCADVRTPVSVLEYVCTECKNSIDKESLKC